jgi:hypothetical protein
MTIGCRKFQESIKGKQAVNILLSDAWVVSVGCITIQTPALFVGIDAVPNKSFIEAKKSLII